MPSLKGQASTGEWFTLFAKTNLTDISELWGQDTVIRKLNPSGHCLSNPPSKPNSPTYCLSKSFTPLLFSYRPPELSYC